MLLCSAPVSVIATRCPQLALTHLLLSSDTESYSLVCQLQQAFQSLHRITEEDETKLTESVEAFLKSCRQNIVSATAWPNHPQLHLLEDHTIAFIQKYRVGLVCLRSRAVNPSTQNSTHSTGTTTRSLACPTAEGHLSAASGQYAASS